MKQKSVKPWVILLVAPVPLLMITAILQTTIRAASGGQSSSLTLVINIISMLIGIASVLMLLGFPVWIILLVMAMSHNSKLKQAGSAIAPTPPQGQVPDRQPPSSLS